jgi:hypothetical protein
MPFFSDGETVAWKNRSFDKLGDGERLLLWHGSRTTNFAGLYHTLWDGRVGILTCNFLGILKQGLRIAPPEGQLFPICKYCSSECSIQPRLPDTCSAKAFISLM